MRIIALEFSSKQRSVAVLTPGREAACAKSTEVERGTRAFALIEQALREAEIGREEIDCVAVGLGPGSYTGIRVAIGIAQGWQLSRGVKLLGMSSAEAIAGRAKAEGVTGRAICVIDAQRREFYVGAYDLDCTPARALEPLRIASAVEVEELAGRGELLIGPEEGVPKGRLVYPDATIVARLALERRDFIAGEQLEPIYLREISFVKAPAPRVQSATP